MNSHRARAYLLLSIVAVIWGFAGPVIKLTLKELPPDIFLLYRFFLSSIIAIVYFLFSGFKLPKNPKVLLNIILYCLFVSTAALGLLFWGTSKTSLLNMSVINLLGPLIMTLSGYIFLKEHITKKEKIGMFIAFIGSFAVVLEPAIKNNHIKGQVEGNILIFMSLLAGSIAAIFLKKLLREDVKPTFLANLSFIIGFITLLPLVFITNSPSEILITIYSLPAVYHLGVIYMSVFSGTIAYSLANIAQKSIEVSEAALFSYLYPIFSAILAVVWLKELPTPIFITGSVIIAAGVILAETKKRN